VRLFGGLATARLSQPKVKDAKSLAFEADIECDWQVTSSTAGAGEAQGLLRITNFSTRTKASDWKLDVEVSKKAPGQLLSAFRQSGVAAVKTVLELFVEEFKLRCPVEGASKAQ